MFMCVDNSEGGDTNGCHNSDCQCLEREVTNDARELCALPPLSFIQISCISVIHSNQLQIEHHIGLSCCEAVHAANEQDHRKVKKKEIWKIARKRA
mmetsp:Transcript_1222/g.1396  ORF Transcript_1222/g.1396 Transcript_1222/m.1396 type:complete len:96 (-) Transcript_1222:23-310(-)